MIEETNVYFEDHPKTYFLVGLKMLDETLGKVLRAERWLYWEGINYSTKIFLFLCKSLFTYPHLKKTYFWDIKRLLFFLDSVSEGY